jgi:hypothetical protein
MVSAARPSATVLSIMIVVGSWGYPSSSKVLRNSASTKFGLRNRDHHTRDYFARAKDGAISTVWKSQVVETAEDCE